MPKKAWTAIDAPSAFPTNQRSYDKLELLQFVGKLFRRAEESPARRKSFPTSWRVSRPSEDDSDKLGPLSSSGVPSEGLEPLQLVGIIIRRAGESPVRQNHLPTS
ncbi:hypothetical protein PSTG_15736 [Puccinia striiformis f. sp. tritici PST-78]|uniref:Uncharacterized protein n=1 Tax=Puccinia striiformis f. sp. tritici PST-78 TaxID=1165861 RepID=A0A0L0UUV3_9BASI|nr:hypothetical protein PSTG_15736 [Puccinia striiformis f. sp. tritici PST-78]